MGGRALHKQTFVHNKRNKNATEERTMAKWQQEQQQQQRPELASQQVEQNLNKTRKRIQG